MAPGPEIPGDPFESKKKIYIYIEFQQTPGTEPYRALLWQCSGIHYFTGHTTLGAHHFQGSTTSEGPLLMPKEKVPTLRGPSLQGPHQFRAPTTLGAHLLSQKKNPQIAGSPRGLNLPQGAQIGHGPRAQPRPGGATATNECIKKIVISWNLVKIQIK